MTLVFSLTIFLSAFLLFSIQPLVGKMILPLLGGSPSVWNTCMVFFQAMLLAGYSYAHFSVKYFGIKKQPFFHIAVACLPLLMLPIGMSQGDIGLSIGNPAFYLLFELLYYVGLPFFCVSVSAPLLQKWYASSTSDDSDDPYFLYAASNVGSLFALLGYPFLIEPSLDTNRQSEIWMFGYWAYLLMIGLCILLLRRKKNASSLYEEEVRLKLSAMPTFRQKCFWVFAALVPSSLMLGVTTNITTNIASVPLLWIIPLSIYLATFILTFAKRPTIPQKISVSILPYAVIGLIPFLFSEFSVDLRQDRWIQLFLHYFVFFIVAMVCHGSLATSRPAARYLTEYFLLISLGGVLGGMLNSIIAPLCFSGLFEYPAMLACACALTSASFGDTVRLGWKDLFWPLIVLVTGLGMVNLVQQFHITDQTLAKLAVFGIPAFVAFHWKGYPVRFACSIATVMVSFYFYLCLNGGTELASNRNFFGVKRVVSSSDGKFHMLIHGGTQHGYQSTDPRQRSVPLAYYHPRGPLGDVFKQYRDSQLNRRVAVIGLGAGATAAYAQPEDSFVFFEIDPAIESFARDPRYFTYLQDCRGKCSVVQGDGRLQLGSELDDSLALIVIDAFSSDSIPAHLITREAIQLYLQKLQSGGVLAFNISNRYLDLSQLLANLAKDAGLLAIIRRDGDISEEDLKLGRSAAWYVVMAKNAKDLELLISRGSWQNMEAGLEPKIWTDSFSNILSVVDW